jgi:uncharacterized protein
MPAILKILLVFFGMLTLSRLAVPIGVAIITGAVVLSYWGGAGSLDVISTLFNAITRPYLWLLLAVTLFIAVFGKYVSEDKNAESIISLAQRWGGKHGKLWGLMALPAIIGLIPMPAGALFSAPLVEQTVKYDTWPSAWKAAVNYWFRHLWEYWWPIFPSVIVALTVFDMPTWQFIAALILFTPASWITGYFFLMRPHKNTLKLNESSSPKYSIRILVVLLPLVIIVASALLLPELLGVYVPSLNLQEKKLTAILIGLCVGIIIIVIDSDRTQLKRIFSSIIEKRNMSLLVTVAGVIIFQVCLEETGLLKIASNEFLSSGFPVHIVIISLPFLAGIITGLGVGYTGLSLPLIAGFMNTDGSNLTPMSTLVLAYGFGYMGVLLSPIHLCLLVSRDYFNAKLLNIYKLILPCVLILMVFDVILFSIFSFFGW